MILDAPSDENTFATSNLPPTAPMVGGGAMDFGNGVAIRNVVVSGVSSSTPPPLPGASQVVDSTCKVTFELRTDAAGTYNIITVSGTLALQETGLFDFENTRFFDTEMLSLNLSGVYVDVTFDTSEVMVRESPTKQSIGRTSIRTTPGGGSHISRFFDVFIELSFDGGQSWMPCINGPMTFALPRSPASEVVFIKGGVVPGAGEPDSGVPADAIITRIGTPSLNVNGDSAVLLKWSSRMSGADSGIFLRNLQDQAAGGVLTSYLVAKAGGEVEGQRDIIIKAFDGTALLDDEGNLVFGGTLSGDGITAKVNDTAVMILRSSGPIISPTSYDTGGSNVVVKKGMAMPEVPGGVLQSVTSFAAPGRGCVVVSGLLQPGIGGITLNNNACLWFIDRLGVGHLVAQENTTVISGSTVKSFSILKPPAKIGGQTLNHNSKQLLWNATLTNGKTVQIHTALP